MFTTIIVQPIFNLLVFITALIPGHNFGLAIIIFTIIVRLLMWPLVKKQLHHAKAMRQLQPELKKIKAAAKGDRQKESQLTMELWKEKEINPFASLGILIVQLPILIGLYASIRRIIDHPNDIVSFSYPFLHHFGWMHQLANNIHAFDNSLFGLVNLTRTASSATGIYWPAMIIVVASAMAQFLQGRQLMPKSQDSRSLRQIMREAGQGSKTDQSEVNAAVGRSTQYLVPVIVLLVSLHLAVALPLYWLVSSTVAYLQQAKVLEQDVTEAEAIADEPSKKTIESKSGIKVTRTTLRDEAKNKKPSSSKSGKRRKR
ncbi:YidC/Oxa1 family membrane protein insertase [Candidatus Saccharibacteria bacterium]|nr:YidC/Oxa1 family membrane protein insertase [Candidatus Saccharibacteria bacterium]